MSSDSSIIHYEISMELSVSGFTIIIDYSIYFRLTVLSNCKFPETMLEWETVKVTKNKDRHDIKKADIKCNNGDL